jgi:hypothetical protein
LQVETRIVLKEVISVAPVESKERERERESRRKARDEEEKGNW